MKFPGSLLLAGYLCVLASTAEAVTLSITITGPNTGNVSARLSSGAPGGGLCLGSSTPFDPVTCHITFSAGDHVRVMANSPSAPGMLGGGAGDAAGCPAESTCNFFINGPSAMTVTFSSAHPTRSIQVDFLGEGEMTADHNRCQNWELGSSGCPSNYVEGSEVILTGRNTPGSLFVSFSGGTVDAASCTSSPCTFELNSNSTIDATFAALTSVSVDPPTATASVGGTRFFSGIGTFTNGGTRVLQGGPGSWRNKRPMTEARFSLAAGVIGDRLYAVGGIINDGDGPSTKLERYDPAVGPTGSSDRWNLNPGGFPLPPPTPLASMLVPREGLAVAALDGKLYAIGGHTSGGAATATVEAYTPVSDPGPGNWVMRADLSVARTWAAAAVMGSTLYVVGGGEQVDPDGPGPQIGPSDILEAYDVLADGWTSLAPMPTPRTGLAATVAGGKLYAIGGFNGGNLATVEAFHPATGWETRAPMPTPRTLLEAVTIDGLIYAVGGINGLSLNTVEVYDPDTNSWTTLASTETARSQFGLGALDGRLWAVGGLDAGAPAAKLASLEAFRPAENSWWSSMPPVATIDPNGQANALSAGTTSIIARSVGISCISAACATLTVTDGGGPPPPPPPPDDECARVTFTLLPGSLPFDEVQITVSERSSGETFGPFPVAIGEPQEISPGQYHLVFSAPAGYRVTSAQRGLNIACGDDVSVTLRFSTDKP